MPVHFTALLIALYGAGVAGNLVWQHNRYQESPYKERLEHLIETVPKGQKLRLLFGIPARPFVLFSLYTLPALLWPASWPLMAYVRERKR